MDEHEKGDMIYLRSYKENWLSKYSYNYIMQFLILTVEMVMFFWKRFMKTSFSQ